VARARGLLLAGILLAAALPASPARKAAGERDLQELRGRIERLQKELAAAEESRGEAVDQLKESARAVSESQRALFELARQRRGIEGELEGLARQEREIRAGMAEQEALAGKLLRLQYQQGAPDRLRLALEGKDAATATRHLQYYGYIQRSRAALIGELRQKGERLAALGVEAGARRELLAQNEGEAQREAERLERERAQRASVVARLAGDIARNRAEIGKLKRDETRLAKLVEEIARTLAKKEAERREAERREAQRKEPDRKAAGPRGRPVDRVADASTASRPFAQLQGKLRLPVKGELANRFGGAREEAGSTWKGLFIRAVTGATVHAVADGRVVYSDWLRGFGNLLILDHGNGFMSLYAYADSLLRPVGESVRSGDAIAHAGTSAGNADSGLYFELRRDGKPFDPMRWVAQ
jgi:septal ring factor EnvC (AmiA/AmiB activator)